MVLEFGVTLYMWEWLRLNKSNAEKHGIIDSKQWLNKHDWEGKKWEIGSELGILICLNTWKWRDHLKFVQENCVTNSLKIVFSPWNDSLGLLE